MAKFAHKLCLPNVVLAPVLALLKQRGLRIDGSEGLGFTLSDPSVLPIRVGIIQTKGYTFNLKTDSYPLWQAIDQEMKTYQFKNLMNGNFEPELAELMRTDKSFVEAVKRLQALWKVKGQAMGFPPEEAQLHPLQETEAEMKSSPRYNINGTVGQPHVDPAKVRPQPISDSALTGGEN